jgi:hypothetical protein
MNLRVQCAVALSNFQRGKRPALRWVEGITGLKAPQTLEEARQYLARLAFLVAEGRIDIDGAAAIKDQLQAFIDAVVGSEVDQRLRALEEMAREQAARGGGVHAVVQVLDGLPPLPGTNIRGMMPGDPPVIEQQANPWGNVPDAAVSLDVTPKPRPAIDPDADFIGPTRPVGRPRKRPKPEGPP